MAMVKMAKDATPPGKPGSWDAVVDQEKEFEPSILNTSVWLMQMVLQVSCGRRDTLGCRFRFESMSWKYIFFRLLYDLFLIFCRRPITLSIIEVTLSWNR